MSENGSQRQMSLVEDGDPEATVVWWGDGDEPVAEFAASELQAYVEAMTGASLEVAEAATDTSDGTVASGVALVSAGGGPAATDGAGAASVRSAWAEALADALSGTREDSFALQSTDDAVVLGGSTPRGTLYAAYDLLERLGVRFYAPDYEFYDGQAERVPSASSLAVGDVDAVEEPSLAYRRKDLAEGRSHTTETVRQLVDWMAKTRHNVLATPADFTNLDRGVVTWDEWRDAVVPELDRRGLLLEVGGHGFDAFLPPEEYEADHPEWFVDDYNVFDITDEDALETYVENTVDYLEAHPEIDIFDTWPPDGADWPPVVTEAFGSSANAYAHVVSELDAAIADRLPDRDVTLEAIAYTSHIEVPDPEYMYDDDVVVDFAPFDRSYSERIFESEGGKNREYVELMREWREAFEGTLSTYEYYRKYSWHSLPVVLPTLIGEEIPFYESVGLDGLWLYSEPADWIPYELTHALVAALQWDTDVDADAYVDRYLAERYGEGAAAMATYLDRVEHAGRTLFDKFRGDYDDPATVAEALESFREAQAALAEARSAVPDDSTAAFLLDRLATNAEFAVADTEISHYELQGDDVAAEAARSRARELVDEHCFEGVVLKSNWALDRCLPPEEVPDAATLIAAYQHEWDG